MKHKCFAAILAACATGFVVPAPASRAAVGTRAFASLEKNFRETAVLGEDATTVRTPHYPRVKRLPDGGYFLLCQSGKFGGRILFATSPDGLSYTKPVAIFSDKPLKLPAETGPGTVADTRRYMTADAVVLANGDILVVASFRAVKAYRRSLSENGIVIRRSSDKGRTWSPEQRIYTGTNWEPFALQLRSGEVQVYFTHSAPFIHLHGFGEGRRSSGAAMLRSFDNGRTWTPDVTGPPYTAHRVMQQYIGDLDKKRLFTDQMPVAVELINGAIALACESRLLDEKYHISIARSHDNWAAPLGIDEPGPADRQDNIFPGAAPYLNQFPTGETLLTYNARIDGGKIRFLARLGDENARDFGPPLVAFNVPGYWGAACIDSPRTALLAFPKVISENAPKDASGEIHIARFHLNRDITAPNITAPPPSAAVAAADNNTLFIGSDSQSQATLHFHADATHLLIRAEHLDDFPTNDDAITLRLAIPGDKGRHKHITIKVTPSGLAPGAPAGVTTTVLPSAQKNLRIIEIKIPRAQLAGAEAGLRIYPILHNRDTPGSKITHDTLTGADPANPSTWPAIRFAHAPF